MKSSKDSHREQASPRIVSIQGRDSQSPVTLYSSPTAPKRTSFFSAERILIFLTIITAVLALALALWSLHKHSEVNNRINKLNSLMVDAVSNRKPSEKEPKAKKLYNAEAIKERLSQRRLTRSHNAELSKLATEQFEQVKESEIEQARHLNDFHNHTMKVSQSVASNREKIQKEASNVTANMSRIKALPIGPEPMYDLSTIKRPDPMSILSKPIESVGGQMEAIAKKAGFNLNSGLGENKTNDEMGIFSPAFKAKEASKPPPVPIPVPNPIPESASFGGVDLEDLERDILLLGGS